MLMSDGPTDTAVLLGSFELEQVLEEMAPGEPRPKVRERQRRSLVFFVRMGFCQPSSFLLSSRWRYFRPIAFDRAVCCRFSSWRSRPSASPRRAWVCVRSGLHSTIFCTFLRCVRHPSLTKVLIDLAKDDSIYYCGTVLGGPDEDDDDHSHSLASNRNPDKEVSGYLPERANNQRSFSRPC